MAKNSNKLKILIPEEKIKQKVAGLANDYKNKGKKL